MTAPGPVSPFRAGMRCRCPRCGEGPLFDGLLAVRKTCRVCGLDLAAQDSGDGPTVFVILILGFVVVGLVLLVETKFAPPIWVHAAIWPAVIFGGAIAMLRPLKATMIALQFRHRAGDFHAPD
ncbi:MAG: DUF983 domain-containing protein [Rhodospirillales bacterium]|nr:DUF983 domain-containing protein [Rhodospirillales bacterium]